MSPEYHDVALNELKAAENDLNITTQSAENLERFRFTGPRREIEFARQADDRAARQLARNGVVETFKNPADAIGDLHGDATRVGQGRTKNPFWVNQGFTKTEYYVDSNGTRWTVFKNPTTGEYSGGHISSGH